MLFLLLLLLLLVELLLLENNGSRVGAMEHAKYAKKTKKEEDEKIN